MTVFNRKFLLADDDADDANLFCEAATGIGSGVECQTAENGLELFELLSIQAPSKPDVIFLDINMPLMNGWDCLRRLKENIDFKHIPIFMYSTSSARKDIDKAYSMGAQLFLTKPEDFKELCHILEIVATSPREVLAFQLKRFHSVKLN